MKTPSKGNDAPSIRVRVDSTTMDEAIRKAEHLSALLKEANSLANEMASQKVEVSVSLDDPNGEQTNNLRTIPTCELVEELKHRIGVEEFVAEPYQDINVSINGPAIVLVVID